MNNLKPSSSELLRQLRELKKLNKKADKKMSGMQKKIGELEKEGEKLKEAVRYYEIKYADYCD
jgi:septal ring factor EnvC (AmiA/AmiB activator)